MILKMFAVRDSATSMFGTPMFLVTAGQAVRSFTDECNRAEKDNQLYNHSGDFALFSLGEFDTDTGRVVTLENPVQVVRGVDVRVKE